MLYSIISIISIFDRNQAQLISVMLMLYSNNEIYIIFIIP